MTRRSNAVARVAAILALAVLGGACATTFEVDVVSSAPIEQPAEPVGDDSGATDGTEASSPSEPDKAPLQAGDCFTEDELRFADGVATDCSAPHVAEFFAVMDRPEPAGAPWPGLDVVQGEASDFCNSAFGERTGVAGQIGALEILFFRPDPESWDNGDREIACFVQYPEEVTQPLADIDPMRAFGLVSTFGLMAGDCVADDSLVEEVAVTLVDCEEPHWYEVYDSVELEPGPFPGEEEVTAIVDDVCGAAFEPFVGIARAESSLAVERLFPTQQSWESWDDRLVSCVITSDVERSESAAGSGL